MRKTMIIGMMLLALGIEQSVSAAGANFNDIEGHWAQSGIEYMVEQGAISGYPDGTFRPDGTITRSEFSKILSEVIDAKDEKNAFADTEGHWAESSINGLVDEGIIVKSEYPYGYGPDKNITRLEISKMVARGLAQESPLWKAVLTEFQQLPAINLPFNDQDKMKLSDVPYIALANSSGIVNGYVDGTFKMDKSASRAEATVMLKRFLDAKNKKPVLSELLEKFKGEPNIHKFSKSQLEAWIDKEADIERLSKLPINHYTGTSLAENHDALIYPMGHNSSTNDTELVTQAMNDMVGFMNLYENLDYRTIGDAWKNQIRRYYSKDFTYGGVYYSAADLPKLFDVYVKQVKSGKYIQESFFVTDLSLTFKQKKTEDSRTDYIVRMTEYTRFTTDPGLAGVELNKWYKRDIDVRYMQNLWGDRVSWDTADNLYAGYTVVTPYKEVKGK
ncbi:S-layer homology domain-containing protein [Paenibacillus alkaliterrae]|uniref:S-layer homology domain-containing protein n=1 Tax=Paenibacillus alkaliterrae TaxID=320909 RepID=UPI001F20C498|nr:S-layer homology domain-containing protein [Paenibacillus alkaliterrae]MCF2940136.1 S-layer homology domain-containing protein [Paenibacillus alkaliterrae]